MKNRRHLYHAKVRKAKVLPSWAHLNSSPIQLYCYFLQPATHLWKYTTNAIRAVYVDFGSQLILNMNWGRFSNVSSYVISFIANRSSNQPDTSAQLNNSYPWKCILATIIAF